MWLHTFVHVLYYGENTSWPRVGNVYGAHIHLYISTFSFLPIKVFSIPFRIVNGMSPSCNPDPEDREVRGEDTGSIRDN